MKYLTNYVSQGTDGMSAGYVVVEDNGVLKAQKLTFDGTTPQFDGVAEEIADVGIFETGLDEPAYNGSGGGGTAKYYKCDSVDTANKTWSGYELVLQDGVYVVSDTLTEDLAYTGFKPVVGKVYNEGTTILVGMFTTASETLEGCVFAANMQTTSATYNGETVNLEGGTLADAPGYTDGTKALHKTSTTLYDIGEAKDFTEGNISIALSVHCGGGSLNGNYTEYFIKANDAGSMEICCLYQSHNNGSGSNQGTAKPMSGGVITLYDIPFGWNHYVLTFDYSTNMGKVYRNGVLLGSQTASYPDECKLIQKFTVDIKGNDSYMKDLQIYNRVLLEDEITTLYEKAKLPIGV